MHRNIRKSIVCALTAAVAVSALAGCAKKPAADNYAVVGITQEPGIFDPHTVVAAGDEEIIYNIYEGLYKFDYEGNLNPCLATDVEISEDASVYTFKIREGVKFHDGSDLDAADVVYSLHRGLFPVLPHFICIQQGFVPSACFCCIHCDIRGSVQVIISTTHHIRHDNTDACRHQDAGSFVPDRTAYLFHHADGALQGPLFSGHFLQVDHKFVSAQAAQNI